MRGLFVFPTCVGMSRISTSLFGLAFCVPHVRGDEPARIALTGYKDLCSPRAWG